MFAHEQPLHQSPAPCGASHSQMDTYHITSHTKMRKSIKKLMSWEMTEAAEREREREGRPVVAPPLSPFLPLMQYFAGCMICIAYEKS